MTVLVTGGCGFVGSNVAARLLSLGDDVVVLDNMRRAGSEQNLRWLLGLGLRHHVQADTRDAMSLAEQVRRFHPSTIFHLAGQVAMTTSIQDPRADFETNVVGTFNLLESVRLHCPATAVIYASSNKVYGELSQVRLVEQKTRYAAPDHAEGIDESAALDFQTPYGCSKGAADQYILDYARMFDLNTVVFRHSTIYGSRQFATADQGWIGWFCTEALRKKADPQAPEFQISGNGKQVRDLLFVDDAVDCYIAAALNIQRARGQAFNIGGGMANSSSLLELFEFLQEKLQIPLSHHAGPWRPFDQRFFVANCAKARALLGWEPRWGMEKGLTQMLAWTQELQKQAGQF
jgi:CDP-paratose 2-epimerase